ncbi:MAG: TIGR00725 family protein [Candidatus Helarchaeota archaeon]
MIQLGVIGSGYGIDEEVRNIAYEVGAEIARSGAVLICGGKGGVMEAACKGCYDNKGLSIGILPSINREEANQYVSIQIPTNLGENRNYIIVQSSDAIICISGVMGTLIEAEYTIKLNKILVTIPGTGGVAKDIYEKYVNDKKYKVFGVKNGKEAVSLAISKIRKE